MVLQEQDVFCSAVQWVVAKAGWDVLAAQRLKTPCASGGHRVGTGLNPKVAKSTFSSTCR